MMRKRAEGFTLIELLVVIAIIGLLSSIVLASLNTARQNSRDAVRKAQVRQFMNAFELYYAKNGNYPCGATCGSSGVTYFNASSVPGAALISAGVIGTIPNDPQYTGTGCNSTNSGYCYCSLGTDSYVLTVNTEDDKGGSDRCYFRVGPSASTFCTGHQAPGTWATQECTARF
jgi:prepilin-type N-terminal cleavage/methylation domain-containing protein